MRLSLRSNSTRTFIALPAVLLLEQAVRRRPWHPEGVPLMLIGYAAYRLAGRYRLPRAGGPSGMSQGMPERLVSDGVYAWTRNPMYLGHLIFMTGAALTTRSPLAILALALNGPWFGRRVAIDEARLTAAFGEYEAYAARVSRWLPWPPAPHRAADLAGARSRCRLGVTAVGPAGSDWPIHHTTPPARG